MWGILPRSDSHKTLSKHPINIKDHLRPRKICLTEPAEVLSFGLNTSRLWKIAQAGEITFVVETDFEIDGSRVNCHYHEKWIVFSSVSLSDRTGLSPDWARIWSTTRLVRIECAILSTLGCVSIHLLEITHSPLTVTRAVDIEAGHGNQILIRNSGRR